jgi:hypothetical protein
MTSLVVRKFQAKIDAPQTTTAAAAIDRKFSFGHRRSGRAFYER